MKTVWYILAIAIVIIVNVDGDGNDGNPSTVAVAVAASNTATKAEGNDLKKDADSEAHASSSAAASVELEKDSGVPNVAGSMTVRPDNTLGSTEPPVPDLSETVLEESKPERSQVPEGDSRSKPEFPHTTARISTTSSTTQAIMTKFTSFTLATTPPPKADSSTTSRTSLPPVKTSSVPTTSETTMTESSSAKNPKCCCCTNCEEVDVSTVSGTNGGIVATSMKGNNLPVKGISKSPVMAIIITVSFLALATSMSFCYRRRGDISYKVRTWSIRVRQFDFNSLRPVCLRWKKPNSESNPVLVFKVDESELDVLTENMV